MKPISIDDLESRLGRTQPLDLTVEEIPNGYHPFSYFVLGGIDLDGQALSMNGDAMADPDEELSSGCGADAACDPRVSGFDIAEAAGIEAYAKIKDKAEGRDGTHTDASALASSDTASASD